MRYRQFIGRHYKFYDRWCYSLQYLLIMRHHHRSVQMSRCPRSSRGGVWDEEAKQQLQRICWNGARRCKKYWLWHTTLYFICSFCGSNRLWHWIMSFQWINHGSLGTNRVHLDVKCSVLYVSASEIESWAMGHWNLSIYDLAFVFISSAQHEQHVINDSSELFIFSPSNPNEFEFSS